MNNRGNDGQKNRFGLWWKIPVGIFLLLFVGLVVVIWNIDSIAHSQINKALKHYLSEGGTLDAIDIELKKGRIELVDFTINSPQGFGTEPLLALGTLELDVDPTSLFGDEVVVEQLVLKELSLNLVRDRQGQLSLLKLLSPEGAVSEHKTNDDRKKHQPLSIPAIRVNSIRFENISVRLIDQLSGEQWSASLRLDLGVEDLQLKDLLNQNILVGKATLALSDIKIDQPAGFNNGKMAEVEQFKVITDGLDLASPEIVVKQVLIKGFASSVAVNKDGMSNVQSLNQALLRKKKEKSESKAKPEVEPDVSVPENKLPVVRFEKIQMDGASFEYSDEALTEEILVFPMDNIRLAVTQLRLFDENEKAAPASASVSFELGQSGELPTAYFGCLAAIGPIGSGVPSVNSQVRLIGFKLDTLGSLVPPATRTTLGADGFDAGLAFALNNDRLNLYGSALSDKNIRYDAINVHGPLDAPIVEMGAVLAGVFSRVSDGLVNLGKRGFSTGFIITKGGVDVAKELGSGALKVGMNLGESLLKVGTGLVTLDQQELGKGLTGSTKGTVDLTVDSADNTSTAASGGLKDSFSGLKGDAALQAWDKGIPERYRAEMKKAQEVLTKMPYPPVTD
jgi:hypothetical protein